MKIPRDLSGRDLIKTLCRNLGYRIVHQVGSHVILETDDPSHHRLAVPDHRVLRVAIIFANNLPMPALIRTDAAEQTFSLHVVKMIFNAVLG